MTVPPAGVAEIVVAMAEGEISSGLRGHLSGLGAGEIPSKGIFNYFETV